jgi:hypothetical protein
LASPLKSGETNSASLRKSWPIAAAFTEPISEMLSEEVATSRLKISKSWPLRLRFPYPNFSRVTALRGMSGDRQSSQGHT